jgi:hypothetical protein
MAELDRRALLGASVAALAGASSPARGLARSRSWHAGGLLPRDAADRADGKMMAVQLERTRSFRGNGF